MWSIRTLFGKNEREVRQVKRFAAVFALVVLGALPSPTATAQTSGSVEGQTFVIGGRATNQINIFVTGNLPVKKLGWFAWSVTSEGWAQSYVGLTYAPVSWVKVKAGYGLETGATYHGRFGTSILVSSKTDSLFFAFERGNNSWHKLVLNHRFNSWFGIGVMDQRGKGTGPRVEFRTGKVLAWGAVLWKDGKPATTAALSYNF